MSSTKTKLLGINLILVIAIAMSLLMIGIVFAAETMISKNGTANRTIPTVGDLIAVSDARINPEVDEENNNLDLTGNDPLTAYFLVTNLQTSDVDVTGLCSSEVELSTKFTETDNSEISFRLGPGVTKTVGVVFQFNDNVTESAAWQVDFNAVA